MNPGIEKIGQVLLDEEGWNYMVIVFHVNEEMVGEQRDYFIPMTFMGVLDWNWTISKTNNVS